MVSCEDCAYYQRVTGCGYRVLVVSGNQSLAAELAARPAGPLIFKLARNEYEASALIGAFRPSFVVVDSDALRDAVSLLGCLLEDLRVPGLQVLATRLAERMPAGVALLEKPLTAETIERAVRSAPVEAYNV
jgi:hypothetical protein